MKTAAQFYNEVIGKGFDIDGAYGNQCWDGAMYYSRWLGKGVYHCTKSGYVIDIWTERKTSGILNEYKEVSRPYRDGDIIIFDRCKQAPLSHICIFRKDNGNGTFVALGQNQGAPGGVFNQINMTYDGIAGALRPIEPKPKPKPVIVKNIPGGVHRLYADSDHLYTQRVTEAQKLVDSGWKYEGVEWIAPNKGTPVYRMYHKGQHLFTPSKDEAGALEKKGWTNEGIAFYSSGSRPIYRMYNPHDGQHLLTSRRKEHDALTRAGWYCEGTDIKY